MSMQRMCIRTLTGLFVMAALSACDRSVDLRFKAEPGDKRVFHVTREIKFTGPDMMGSSDSEQSTSRATYTYEVTGADDAGNTEVKVTATVADFVVNDTLAPVGALIADKGVTMMEDQGLPMGENPFANLEDAELSVGVDAGGALTSMNGMDKVGEELAARLQALMKEQMSAENEQMEQMLAMMGPAGAAYMEMIEPLFEKITWQLRRFMSDQAVTLNLRFLTDVLPAETVEVGSTWKKDSEIFFPSAFIFETFTVVSRSGGVSTLNYEAAIEPRSDNSIDLGLARLGFEMEGTKTGTIEVDEQTGWVKAANIEVKQNTNMSVKLDLSSLGMGGMGGMPGLGDMPDMPFNMEGAIHVESGMD